MSPESATSPARILPTTRIFRLPLQIRLEVYSQCSAFSLLHFSHTCAQIRHEINSRPALVRSTFGYDDSLRIRTSERPYSDGRYLKRAKKLGFFDSEGFRNIFCESLDFDLTNLSIYNIEFLGSKNEVALFTSNRPPEPEEWILAFRYMFYLCPNCFFIGDYLDFHCYDYEIESYMRERVAEEYGDMTWDVCGNCY
ncbi:hypothetical protein BJ508DRAFT_321998 [Ascobolus immersus RN42]|uniref:F-box domain-containing protein n=1 Tax=Ascobolus immersus RN42 TaxID=1160509 RepID=A0A3N4IKG3_ASCIM|nr:hypothetical protein BJ508DRAFT_321998 [Ascobolus immersus RN42]